MDIVEVIENVRNPEQWGITATLAILIGGIPVFVFSQWVIAPLQSTKFRWHLTRGDMICLGVMILPWLILLHILAAADWKMVVPLDFLIVIFAGTLWFLGVASASAVGIRIPRYRAAAILAVYPLAALGGLAVLSLWTVSITDQICSAIGMGPAAHTALAIVSVLILGVMLICARLARRIAKELKPESPVSDSIPQGVPEGAYTLPQEGDSWDPWRDDTDQHAVKR
jgi:hypothetical protein